MGRCPREPKAKPFKQSSDADMQCGGVHMLRCMLYLRFSVISVKCLKARWG